MTTRKNKRCIVTFASRNSNYINGMARLAESLRDRFDGAFIAFTDELSIGCKPHQESNYAFKIHALQKAIDAGYTQLLWLDCSVFAVNNVNPIFDLIESDGYFIQDSGWKCNEWTNKETLEYFGTDGIGADMFSSGVTGFNIEAEIGKVFFNRWRESMLLGFFNGSWENHRHDQSCGSLIASELKLTMHNPNEYYSYKCENHLVTDKTIFLLEGM